MQSFVGVLCNVDLNFSAGLIQKHISKCIDTSFKRLRSTTTRECVTMVLYTIMKWASVHAYGLILNPRKHFFGRTNTNSCLFYFISSRNILDYKMEWVQLECCIISMSQLFQSFYCNNYKQYIV